MVTRLIKTVNNFVTLSAITTTLVASPLLSQPAKASPCSISTSTCTPAEIIQAIEQQAQQEKKSLERAVAELERDKDAQDVLLTTVERQSTLTRSRTRLAGAQDNLEQTLIQNQIGALTRAQAIAEQLNDNTQKSIAVQTQLERELTELSRFSRTTPLQIIKRRQVLEDRAQQQRFASLALAEAQAKSALESEIRQNQFLAGRIVLEARIREMRTRQRITDAKTELAMAKIAGGRQKIEAAQVSRKLAMDSFKLAHQAVKAAQQQVKDQLELARNSRRVLELEQQGTREKEALLNLAREQKQELDLVRAGGSATSNSRVGSLPPLTTVVPAR